jgi:heptaprenylglyceryl phosphate synthase
MALATKQVTVGTAVVSVLEPQTNQTRVIIHNAEKSSNEFIWIGGSNAVTTSTGFTLIRCRRLSLCWIRGTRFGLLLISRGSRCMCCGRCCDA